MMAALVAVLDIGKTNAKLMLMEEGGQCVWSAERPSPAIAAADHAPFTSMLDVEGIGGWMIGQLRAAPEKHRIRAILPVAHGAAMVLVGHEGEVLLAPDYEDPAFDAALPAYRALRPGFAETLSPALPKGLNLGAQIHAVQRLRPEIFLRTRHILLYPQYWSWRLSGVAASEVTSLGCHTDLWNPAAAGFSSLVAGQGWGALFPPLRPARAALGPLLPSLAQATGLPADCAILCGIHDSNASYLAHRVARAEGEDFAVISSGTWCIILAKGAALAALSEEADMLANVDALGEPTPTARFMGGREYAAIAGEAARGIAPDEAALAEVLAAGALALPSFALAGPFQGRAGRLIDSEALAPPGRAALATLYCVLMADLILDRLGARGAILIDGPFAANPLFARALQALRPAAPVRGSDQRGGIAAAVLWLAGLAVPPAPPPAGGAAPLAQSEALRAYRDRWRSMLTG
ncbi:FGGY-family carbohydrate kinase [Acidisoma sp. C75]